MTDIDEIDFDDREEDELETSGTAFNPMRFDIMQRKVKDLLSDYTSRELDPRPSFQRGYVWDKSRASKLIESILLNVPLPLIYTAEEPDQREVVIDGQQRLLSVFGFIQGSFPKDNSKFKLSGLKLISALNGKGFLDLDPKDQKAIQRYIFQIIRISNESDANVKFEIFERLNSGSVTLNAQELRNCVYRGKFNTTLKKLSELPDFRKLLGTGTSTNRMQDVELVLRFLAFFDKTYLNYTGGMKTFLNDFMDENKNLSEDKALKFSEAFKTASNLAFSVFGDNAFKKFSAGSAGNPDGGWERQINRPLFDIVMWGFTRFDKNAVIRNGDAIRDKLIILTTEDAKFLDAITSAVGDKGKTQYRFEQWQAAMKQAITGELQPRNFSRSIKTNLFKDDPVCKLCNQTIHSLDDAHTDHIVPFSKGGSTTLENAQLTHRYCNLRKSSNE